MRKHSIGSVFTLVLFTVFAITALFVTAGGAMVYQKTAAETDRRFNRQTCLNYITAKIHAGNEAGAISVADFDGNSALCFTSVLDGTEYATYIYYFDGAVRELFCNKAVELGADAGSAIAEAGGLDFSLSDGLVSVSFTDAEGKSVVQYVNVL